MNRQGDVIEITRELFHRGYEVWRDHLQDESALGELTVPMSGDGLFQMFLRPCEALALSKSLPGESSAKKSG